MLRRFINYLYANSQPSTDSLTSPSDSSASKDSTVVFVTGNAPYKGNKYNTSRMIRDALPSLISRPGKPDIIILKYCHDSRDTYREVLKMVGEVWRGHRLSFLPMPSPGHENDLIDFAFGLHLGMSPAVPEFRAEKFAHRDGYKMPGEDGMYCNKKLFQKFGLPSSLASDFDIDNAVASIKEIFPEIPIRSSDNPNQGFCEFRLYCSLAVVQLNYPSKTGKAALFHVPADQSPEAIKLGADIVAAYITALVDGLPTQGKAVE